MIAPTSPPAASLGLNDRQYLRPSAKKSAANIHNFGKKRTQSGNKKAFSAMYETSRIAIVNQAKPRRQESLLSDDRPNNVHERMSSAVNGRRKKKTSGALQSGCGFRSDCKTNERRKRVVRVPLPAW